MNRYFLLCVVIGIISWTFFVNAEEPYDCSIHYLNASGGFRHVLQYTLSTNGQNIAPHVDSVWIIDYADTTRAVLISHAQSGDYINISRLERGYHLLNVQVGECLYRRRFGKRYVAVAREHDITMQNTVVAPHRLRFVISENGLAEPPHVDSLWIVGFSEYCEADTAPRIFMRTNVQSGDTINLKPLLDMPETTYHCVAWIDGSDYWSDSFHYCGECDGYADVKASFSIINPHHAILDISHGDQPAPHLDSLWVTTYAGDSTLLTAKPQSGDTIDLSPLVGRGEAYYKAWLRLANCLKTFKFDFTGLEYDYCLEADIRWLDVEGNDTGSKIQYYLYDYNYHTKEPVPVDSLWITVGDRETYLCSVDVVSQGEDIDVSFLPSNLYFLHAQIGGCEANGAFYLYARYQDNTIVNADESPHAARKFLRNGQILILRGDKTYTLTGQQLR